MIDRIMREVRRNIEAHGQHVFIIFPDSIGKPGFAYTIGNSGRGLPELLVIGSFQPALACRILNDFGAKMREDGRPLPKGLVDIGWSYPFRIRKAGPAGRSRFTIKVGRHLGHENYEVLQVMICDAGGRYPGEKGCDPGFDVEQPQDRPRRSIDGRGEGKEGGPPAACPSAASRVKLRPRTAALDPAGRRGGRGKGSREGLEMMVTSRG